MDLKIREFEISILKSLRNNSNQFFDSLFKIFTFLGEPVTLVLILLVIYFMYDKQFGKKLTFTVFSSLLINNVVKGLVKYPRPYDYDNSLNSYGKSTATGYSFPSGHTQIASTLYFGIAKDSKIERKLNIEKLFIWILAFLFIILVAFSRVYLGVHYPKDVIVGILLGIGCSFLFSFIYDKFSKKYEEWIYLITLLIYLPFVTIFIKDTYSQMYPYKDFYTIYSLFLGFTIACIIEKKYINFTCNVSFKTKLLRITIGGLVAVACIVGLKALFPKDNMFFVCLRYFLTSLLTMGIYPLVFRKTLFTNKNEVTT